MTDAELLSAAKSEVSDLVDDVIDQIYDLAYRCRYEPDWVLGQFKSQLARECERRGVK